MAALTDAAFTERYFGGLAVEAQQTPALLETGNPLVIKMALPVAMMEAIKALKK